MTDDDTTTHPAVCRGRPLLIPNPGQLPPPRRAAAPAPSIAADMYLDVTRVLDRWVWGLAICRPGLEPEIRTGNVSTGRERAITTALGIVEDLTKGRPVGVSSPAAGVAECVTGSDIVVFPRTSAAAHPHRSAVHQAMLEESDRAIRLTPRLDVATDGSWSRGKRSAGWAFLAADGTRRWGYETRAASPAAAELAAISGALRAFPAPRRLRVLTDSREAIAHLRTPHRAPRALRHLAFDVCELLSGRDVELRWVKGHRGAGLHDGADRLARAVRRARDAGTTPAREVTERITAESLEAHGRGPSQGDFAPAA